jgi:hypothetical protein
MAGVNTIQKIHLRPGFGLSLPATPLPAVNLDQLTPERLRLRDAIRIKSAELWLQLGLPELASRELERLPASADGHPWTLRVQMLVWSALTFE